MDKKALYNLLGKYLTNSCTPDEAALIDNWLALLQENESFTAYTEKDLDSIHHRIWAKIQETTHQNTETEKPLQQSSLLIRMAKWAVAASFIGLILYSGWYFIGKKPLEKKPDFASIIPTSGMQKQTNATASPLKLILEDSSVVVLEPNATINYPVHFVAARREVYLDGKAFFEVSKNAKRPFFIYHNNLVTHVLGTSFIINTKKQGNEAEVSVITGRVEVSENSRVVKLPGDAKLNGVILTPNQKVIYAEDSRQFMSSIVEKPLPVKTKTPGNFDFENAGIGTVLTAVSKEYAIEIVAENEYINRCTFTGDITKEGLYAKLDIICKAINASYEIKGTKVLVKGAGCD